MIDAVIARLEDRVEALASHVREAAQLAQLMESGQLPQAGFTAFVLPGALRGASADAVTGLFRQNVIRTVSIMLVLRVAGDARGTTAMGRVQPMIDACIAAICGWSPDDTTTGVFQLAGGELASLAKGTLTYVLDFSINDQLRLIP